MVRASCVCAARERGRAVFSRLLPLHTYVHTRGGGKRPYKMFLACYFRTYIRTHGYVHKRCALCLGPAYILTPWSVGKIQNCMYAHVHTYVRTCKWFFRTT